MQNKSMETVKKTFNEEGLTFFEEEGGMSLFFGIAGRNGKYMCNAIVKSTGDDIGDIITVISHCSEFVPAKKRTEILEFMNKINSMISVGNFQMGPDGCVYFRTGVQVPEHQLTSDIVRTLLISNIIIMDNTFPLITDVIHRDADSLDDESEEDIFEIYKDEMSVI